MSETPEYIMDFIKAIAPEAPHLYMASFNEEKAIRDATALITTLEAEQKVLIQALEWYAERARSMTRYLSKKVLSPEAVTAICTELSLDAGKRAEAAQPKA